MRFLRKILLALVILVVLAVIKIVLQKRLPHSLQFHFNLLSCIQLITLSWAVITGILESTTWKNLPHLQARRKSFLTFVFLLCSFETVSYWMLHHPSSIPRILLPTAKYYYNNYTRNIVQFDPAMSRYDSSLFYRLIGDNRCLFSNIEFSDSIYTDYRGFRDDSHALDSPAIVCLGDSYTLGWGVQQHEAFPSLLQQMTGTTVLNTGMSSYGTARELASIRSLNRSALRTVIIQYCSNDADENEAYVRNGDKPFISPPSVYDSAKDVLKWSTAWFPFKYFCTSAKIFLTRQVIPAASKALLHGPSGKEDTARFDKEASLFLQVLKGSDLNFDSVNVYVFNIEAYDDLSEKFISALEKQLAGAIPKTQFKDHVHTVHIEHLFTPADYYILDDHIRPSGHIKLAHALAGAIGYSLPASAAIPARAARPPAPLPASPLHW